MGFLLPPQLKSQEVPRYLSGKKLLCLVTREYLPGATFCHVIVKEAPRAINGQPFHNEGKSRPSSNTKKFSTTKLLVRSPLPQTYGKPSSSTSLMRSPLAPTKFL